MGDFFAFRRMIAPLLIHVLFWVGVIVTVGLGVLMIMDRMDIVWEYVEPQQQTKESELRQTSIQWLHTQVWGTMDKNQKLLTGVAFLIGGPFFLRIYCELLMLPFRINDTLTDIRNLQKEKQIPPTTAPAPRRV